MSRGRTGTSPRRPRTPGRDGEAAQESLSLEDDDRDLAVCSRGVLVVVRPDPGHQLPEPLALVALRVAGADSPAVAQDLDLGIWVLANVPVPAGMPRRTALRCYEHDVVTVATEDERTRPLLTARAGSREEDRDRRVFLPAIADPAVCLEVAANVLVAEQVSG